ncbi:hypothetical protein SAMN04488574_102432 [Bacillus sp. 71mf]|uniref:hypothetical protein n=1 Tax=Bacillus sp. 103mf TaxID=1761751 RepID=UPI0008EA3728|nr:hypothetical protein [Bacillus sp. 103mf]SFI35282.1 hypothetical protein SAMN04488574_102432 [Bacillus sp. 71mf]SFS35341.1 hypothetical protein SAMN04488145_10133 [Bacillus sp. 103mf]
MKLSINYNNVKVADYLKLLAHYKLPNKKQHRLIENRFVCINALVKNGGEQHSN